MTDDLKDVVSELAQRMLVEWDVNSICTDVLIGFCDLMSDEALRAIDEHPRPHKKPHELLPGTRSGMAFFLPFNKEIVESNRGGRWASREWVEAYISVNRLAQRIGAVVSLAIGAAGEQARSVPPTGDFSEETLSSNWSHKLIGELCGLGHIGLHQMLITPAGCAGRLISLVTTAELEPSSRSDAQLCAYLRDESCVECIEACPVGAVRPDGFDAQACYRHCIANALRLPEMPLAEVCGKCAATRCALGPG
ncbi:epoxyqueuosine reductase [bacterium]|nr:epoxyqueuosine reductase [bacterium]